jgi:hypothetical protein
MGSSSGGPFNNPNNVVKQWIGSDGQYNQKVVNPDSPDYGAHRGYVPDGSGRQFEAGKDRKDSDRDR